MVRPMFYIHLFILFVLVSGFNAFMYFYAAPLKTFVIIPVAVLFVFVIISLSYEREMKIIWGNRE